MTIPKLFPFVTPRMDPRPMRPDKPRQVKPSASNQAAQRERFLPSAIKHPANKLRRTPTQAEVRAEFARRHPDRILSPAPLPSTTRLAAMLSASTQSVEGQTRDKPGYGARNREIRREIARRINQAQAIPPASP